MNNFLGPNISIAMLRVLMGLVFMAHGLARLVDYSIPGFGEFLDSKGFPAGFYLAWAVTIVDIAGGLLMVMRKFVKIFCVWEIIVLLTGIIIVHMPNGWFVVGKTLGGIEYSVVLVVVLTSIILAEKKIKAKFSDSLSS